MQTKKSFISKLSLCNFKGFSGAENTISFNERVNYLIGDNNSGKTTILQALLFALNGKIDNIDNEALINSDCRQENQGAPAYIEIEVTTILSGRSDGKPDVDYDIYRRYLSFNYHFVDELLSEDVINDFNGRDAVAVRKRLLKKDNGLFVLVKKEEEDCLSRLMTISVDAFTTPRDIINNNAKSILTSLTSAILTTKKFEKSGVWKAYCDAFEHVISDSYYGLNSQLNDIGERVSSRVSSRFPNIKVIFNSKYRPTQSDILRFLEVTVTENERITGDLSTKGSGLQIDVALALAFIQAEYNLQDSGKKGLELMICYDEPETWLHPKAQIAFSQDCSRVARQQFVATHSPFILKSFNYEVDSCNVLARDTSAQKRLRTRNVDIMGISKPAEPSLSEIIYRAFDIPTVEFHSELYGKLHSFYLEDHSTIKAFDENILRGKFHLKAVRPKRFNSRGCKAGEEPGEKCFPDESLPTAIRNSVDHPESYEKYCNYFGDQKNDTFVVTDELLRKSIEQLLKILDNDMGYRHSKRPNL